MRVVFQGCMFAEHGNDKFSIYMISVMKLLFQRASHMSNLAEVPYQT